MNTAALPVQQKRAVAFGATAALLAVNGVTVEIEGDDLIVRGGDGAVAGGGLVATHLDHRIAMSFLCLGLASREPMAVDDATMIATSYPSFVADMGALGAAFS